MISDRAVSVCRQVDSTLRDSLHIPARKRCVIENGAELATFLSVSRNPSADTVTFGNIGRLEPVKDHETLLKAFSIVRKKHPHVKLRLLGDGSLRQQLETLAANLSVADDVRFEGFSLDTARFLATIDIYVIPSRSEGLPLTLLEAMAAALPVVSAAVGAIPEVLAKTRCAWTCPPADPDSLASAMEQAMHTPGLGTIGLRNRQVVQVDYAIERMDRDYEHLYRTLLSA